MGFLYGEKTTLTGGEGMLDEGYNPYESDAGSSHAHHVPRAVPARGTGLALADADIKAPQDAASIRDFDFAAAMFADDSAWRELARVIANEAA